MRLNLAADGVPIYRQIVNQIKYLVAAGRLDPDEELPPIRVLAHQLTVNPNTVAKAYRELEQQNVVYKRRGAGTYVSPQPSPLARREKRRLLQRRIDALLSDARQLNVDYQQVLELLEERRAALEKSNRQHSSRKEA